MITKIVFISLLFYCSISCKVSNSKNSNDIERLNDLIDNLDSAIYQHDTKKISKTWDSIMNSKTAMLTFLIDSTNTIPHKYIWYDTVHKRPYARIYQEPRYSVGKLFLICAIANDNLFFAFDQKIYDNNIIDSVPDLKKISWNSKIYKSLSHVDYSEIWKSVYDWNSSGRIGRPFKKTNYYWLGEKGGKLTFENSFDWIIR